MDLPPQGHCWDREKNPGGPGSCKVTAQLHRGLLFPAPPLASTTPGILGCRTLSQLLKFGGRLGDHKRERERFFFLHWI
ncbi:hypothetical protein XENTR_v10004636 [Xenopus tropicalis]|nr:hypothetical protein XENTR_v10004636 [Xenopus tropicalis]